MAAKFRKIDPRMWADEKFMGLHPLEKLVAVYCLTSDQCNRIGLYVFSEARAAEELGLTAKDLRYRLDTVCRTLFWPYDRPRRVLYLPTWWKYNRPENPKAFTGYLQDLHDLPATPLLDMFKCNTRYLPDTVLEILAEVQGYRLETVSPQETETEQETEQEQEKPPYPPGGNGNGIAPKTTPIPTVDIDAVVAHYQGHHPRSKPGGKERDKIRDRLREGYTVADLCEAIDGCHKSAWHQGANERGRKFDSLELIVRDAKHVTDFIESNNASGATDPRGNMATANRLLKELEDGQGSESIND